MEKVKTRGITNIKPVQIDLREIKIPKIVASSGDALRQEILKRGLTVDQVFFKGLFGTKNDYQQVIPELKHAYEDCEIEIEFKTLVQLHRVLPEYIVEPIALVTSNADRSEDGPSAPVTGYIMHYVYGVSLYKTNKTIILSHLENLIGIIEKLNMQGLGHGDPNISNVMLSAGFLKLIDPLPFFYPEQGDGLDMEAMIDNDQDYVKMYRRMLRNGRYVPSFKA